MDQKDQEDGTLTLGHCPNLQCYDVILSLTQNRTIQDCLGQDSDYIKKKLIRNKTLSDQKQASFALISYKYLKSEDYVERVNTERAIKKERNKQNQKERLKHMVQRVSTLKHYVI